MEKSNDIRSEVDRLVYITGLSKGAIVLLVAEMNGVTRQTVYNWLRDQRFPDRARVMFALKEIERDYSEQAASLGLTL